MFERYPRLTFHAVTSPTNISGMKAAKHQNATFCMLFSGLFNWHMLHANTAPLHVEVIDLKRQGWKVTETHSSVEARPGIKPYQNLKRVVQVVKYKLNKGTEVLFCVVEYDSQWDTIRESCADSLQQAEKKLRQ